VLQYILFLKGNSNDTYFDILSVPRFSVGVITNNINVACVTGQVISNAYEMHSKNKIHI